MGRSAVFEVGFAWNAYPKLACGSGVPPLYASGRMPLLRFSDRFYNHYSKGFKDRDLRRSSPLWLRHFDRLPFLERTRRHLHDLLVAFQAGVDRGFVSDLKAENDRKPRRLAVADDPA